MASVDIAPVASSQADFSSQSSKEVSQATGNVLTESDKRTERQSSEENVANAPKAVINSKDEDDATKSKPKIFDNKNFVEAPLPKVNPWGKTQSVVPLEMDKGKENTAGEYILNVMRICLCCIRL